MGKENSDDLIVEDTTDTSPAEDDALTSPKHEAPLTTTRARFNWNWCRLPKVNKKLVRVCSPNFSTNTSKKAYNNDN